MVIKFIRKHDKNQHEKLKVSLNCIQTDLSHFYFKNLILTWMSEKL